MTSSETQREVLRSVKWLFSSYVFQFVASFGSLYFVTRHLGPEKFGELSYVVGIYSFVEMFLQFVNQDVFKKKLILSDDKQEVFQAYFAFQLRFILAVIAVTQSLFWLLEFETYEKRIMLLILSLGMIFRVADVISYLFSAEMKNAYIGKSDMVTVGTFEVTRFVLALKKMDLIAFVYAFVFQKLVNFGMLVYIFRQSHRYRLFSSKMNRAIVGELIRNSLPLFLAAGATTLFMRIDQVMLGRILTDADVGIYSAAVKLFEPWSFVAIVICQSMYPVLVKAIAQSVPEYEQKVQKTFCILLYAALAAIALTMLFSDLAVRILFSAQFMDSARVLRVHIFGLIFSFWMTLSVNYEIINGLARFTLYKTVLTSVFNIVLNYFLIKRFGVIGASYAVVLSLACSSFLLNACFGRLRRLFWLQLGAFAFWRFRRA
jgi:O-antigen/teichoic acid export membrane protein